MGKITRVIAGDEKLRGFFIESTDIAEEARDMFDLNPVATAALGRMLSITSIMGLMLKSPDDIITTRVDGDGGIKGMLATSDSTGNVKGCVFNNDFECFARSDGKLDVGGAVGYGTLSVVKDLRLKEPYVSTVPLLSGEIAEDFTYYFATSEQTPTSVGAGVLLNKDDASVEKAGAFIIQLLPGAKDELVEKLENNLADFSSLTQVLSESGMKGLMAKILKDLYPKVLDEVEVLYRCDCSDDKVYRAIASLSKEELSTMATEEDSIEVVCNFCNNKRTITKEQLLQFIED